jgi:hypothetical protein
MSCILSTFYANGSSDRWSFSVSLGLSPPTALQFDAKSAGPMSKSRPFVELEGDKDWNPKKEDVEVASREVQIGRAASRYEDSRPDSVTDLKQRLSVWGRFSQIGDDNY